MSDFRRQLKFALERAIVSANAESDEEIEAVLKTFRSRADGQIATMREKDSELARRATRVLDEALMEFHMTPSNEFKVGTQASNGTDASLESDDPVENGSGTAVDGERQTTKPDDRSGPNATADGAQRQRSALAPFLTGIFVTLCAGALAVFLAHRAGYLSEFTIFTADHEKPIVIPSEDVARANQVLPEIVDTVLTAKAILDSDPESVLVEDPKRFHQFRNVFPDLYEALSPTAKQWLRFVVRRDGSDYKILLSSAHCPVMIQFGGLQEDPRRSLGYQVLCAHFGVWNDGGKNF